MPQIDSNFNYPGGYILDKRTDRVNELAPGRMGKKQEARAQTLLVHLQEQVRAALLASGWEQRWKTPHGDDLWVFVGEPQDSSVEQDTVTEKRVLAVPASKRNKGYTRTVLKQPVAFTCARCEQAATKVQYPGKTPRYCKECDQVVAREQTRLRVARLRTRRQKETKNG